MKNSLTLSCTWISIYFIMHINDMMYKYFILVVCLVQGSNFNKHPLDAWLNRIALAKGWIAA